MSQIDFNDFLIAIRKHGDAASNLVVQNKSQAPFVKWAGGKRNILSEIMKWVPETFNTYYEPFVGGGALFFALTPHPAVIVDKNNDLIIAYHVIKKDVERLIERLEKHKENHSKEYYYRVREEHNLDDPVEVAARFIYLNKTCYNGLYRVNKQSHFNVPIGRNKNPNISDKENLLLCHRALQDTTILVGDFEMITPKRDDFVYFDPPYHETFTGYTGDSFTEQDQVRLCAFYRQLSDNGVSVMLSNSDTAFIRDLYKGFNIAEISAPRYINCKADNRKNGKELLITNYDTGRQYSK